jgi:hypothetical protein
MGTKGTRHRLWTAALEGRHLPFHLITENHQSQNSMPAKATELPFHLITENHQSQNSMPAKASELGSCEAKIQTLL